MRYVLTAGWLGLAAMLAVSCGTDSEGIKPIPVGATATSGAQVDSQDAVSPTSPKTTAPSVTTSLEPPPPVIVTPEKAEATLISADDVGKIVGSPLTFEVKSSTPEDSPRSGKCEALAGPFTDVLGDEWTTYRHVVQKESKERYDHIVWQAVVLFADAKTAADQMKKAFPDSLKSCVDTEQPTGDLDWRVESFSAEGKTAKWVEQQLNDGKPSAWRCFFEYRAKNNVVFGTRLCQAGNGAPAVTAIVDRMAEWIPE
ncbi:sensor domain-containing protein [Mycobacterium sp. D16R24]|uniref:sensor domain-containing protein n=1 Tax=Mycobacterium sp. D16R24 TaxID=1855656 RepID=UPI000992DA99|nr:sensor domain-containing protein [Mycobacterium sp. D16R24]